MENPNFTRVLYVPRRTYHNAVREGYVRLRMSGLVEGLIAFIDHGSAQDAWTLEFCVAEIIQVCAETGQIELICSGRLGP